MRELVISDIHSNLETFQAVLLPPQSMRSCGIRALRVRLSTAIFYVLETIPWGIRS